MKFIFLRSILAIILITALIFVIAMARGYRFNFKDHTLIPTGILVASSYPTGAKILVNGHLKGATNSNILLSPGVYTVEIAKEGYSSWQKQIIIKGEVVVKADALLFPQNPSLSPITNLGVIKSYFFGPDDKIVIISQDGVYLLDNSKRPLSIFNPLKLLVLKSAFGPNFDGAATTIKFSPDGKQLMLTVGKAQPRTYLLSSDEASSFPFDITQSKQTIDEAWTRDEDIKNLKIFETLKRPLDQIATDSFKLIAVAPDESKLLYQAKKNFTLPAIIKPPLIGTNQSLEERNLKAGKLYVYDELEDKNFAVADIMPVKKPKTNVSDYVLWYPDSKHLILREQNQISLIDYDGENKQTVYSGPFESGFIGVNSDGKLLILANLNPQTNKFPDVYAVGIR